MHSMFVNSTTMFRQVNNKMKSNELNCTYASIESPDSPFSVDSLKYIFNSAISRMHIKLSSPILQSSPCVYNLEIRSKSKLKTIALATKKQTQENSGTHFWANLLY